MPNHGNATAEMRAKEIARNHFVEKKSLETHRVSIAGVGISLASRGRDGDKQGPQAPFPKPAVIEESSFPDCLGNAHAILLIATPKVARHHTILLRPGE